MSGYRAVIVNFDTDAAQPSCTIETHGLSAGPSCDQVLKQYASEGEDQGLTRLVALSSITTGQDEPYRGNLDWGQRVSFVAIDLYPPDNGAKPACAVVAIEGADNSDPCETYADASALSEEERRSSQKIHLEQSLFTVRENTTRGDRCKTGESASQARGCVP